jgi:sugar fermentation stimulation protein A
MKWTSPLVTGTLLKRYKRFLVDVRLENGDVVTAHCANTGAMLGLPKENAQVWLSVSPNPNRALPYSYEMIAVEGTVCQPQKTSDVFVSESRLNGVGLTPMTEADDVAQQNSGGLMGLVLVGVNTSHPNTLVMEALQAGTIPELHGYDTIKREATIGKSRLDFKLSKAGLPDCYVEVKNCHLKRTADTLEFPDGVTSRGAKHLEELIALKQQGLRAVMLYIGQRNDCTAFKIAADLDPAYAKAFTAAQQAGVEMLCYDCVLTEEGITLGKALGVEEI